MAISTDDIIGIGVAVGVAGLGMKLMEKSSKALSKSTRAIHSGSKGFKWF